MARPLSKISSASTEPKRSALRRIRALSHLLDNAISIPGTTHQIGLDPLLGLLPGAGDLIGTVLSAYIVLEAARFGLPRSTLARMAFNIVSETALGSLPLLGDLFDATWKANSRNIALLEAHLDQPGPRQKTHWWFLILLLIGVAVVVIGLVALGVVLIELLIRAVSG